MKTKAPKRAVVSASRIDALAARTADAYAHKLFASWKACAAALLRRGYTDQQAEDILRSKLARWASDQSSARYGRATSADLLRFLDKAQGSTRQLLDELVSAALAQPNLLASDNRFLSQRNIRGAE